MEMLEKLRSNNIRCYPQLWITLVLIIKLLIVKIFKILGSLCNRNYGTCKWI